MENHHFHWNNSLSMALSGISSSGFFPAFETPGRSISSFIPRRQQRPQRRRSHRTQSPDIFVWKTHRVYRTQHLGSWSHLFKSFQNRPKDCDCLVLSCCHGEISVGVCGSMWHVRFCLHVAVSLNGCFIKIPSVVDMINRIYTKVRRIEAATYQPPTRKIFYETDWTDASVFQWQFTLLSLEGLLEDIWW